MHHYGIAVRVNIMTSCSFDTPEYKAVKVAYIRFVHVNLGVVQWLRRSLRNQKIARLSAGCALLLSVPPVLQDWVTKAW